MYSFHRLTVVALLTAAIRRIGEIVVSNVRLVRSARGLWLRTWRVMSTKDSRGVLERMSGRRYRTSRRVMSVATIHLSAPKRAVHASTTEGWARLAIETDGLEEGHLAPNLPPPH